VRQLVDLTPAEIRAVIPDVFPADGHAESHHLLDPVAEKLDSSRTEVPPGYRGTRVTELYVGRVKAALVRLAADGTLVRVGAKDQPPDGASPGSVHYYTPEGFAAAKARSAQRKDAALAAEVRWNLIAARLAAVNVRLRPNGSLTAEDWEHLLEAAGL
jgi:hypothetical protein